MKIHLSKNAVNNLLLMLDDCYRLDVGYPKDNQIWGDFDCLSIMRDLMNADRCRSDDGFMDINEETVEWISVVTKDTNIDLDKQQSKHTISNVTVQALVKSSKIHFGIA